MNEIANIRSENDKKIKIQEKLLQWDKKDNPLAPLSAFQNDIILALSQVITNDQQDGETNKSDETNAETPIESTQEFLSYYNGIDDEIMSNFDYVYTSYYEQLAQQSRECDSLLNEVDESVNALTKMSEQYTLVSNKTLALHNASENLLQEQTKLAETCHEIRRRLNYFTQLEKITQRLQNPAFSVTGEAFVEILNTIDECLDYLKQNPKFKESHTHTIKYRQCLVKAVYMMKNYVTGVLKTATEQVMSPPPALSEKEQKEFRRSSSSSSDIAFALYYGKFQASAPRVKKISTTIEQRYEKSPEYEQLLSELHQFYLNERAVIMKNGVNRAVTDLTKKHKGDHCTLVRAACAFLVHVCQDEHRLFFQFFTIPSGQLITFQEGLCTILYDTLRPFIIHINHLETLAEICSILRVEHLEEHVQQHPESLEAFGKVVFQLLQDVQERLVFRAHLYLQSDIQNYAPSSGDLAYPEKLEMMENIALSLQESSRELKRSDSRSSMFSTASQEVDSSIAAEQQFKSRTGNSPADLHGMWYPTVRRTLVCLSRLYRCVDRPIFQGLSQEALTYCIQSVSAAATAISTKKTPFDGQLFEIKHLLILREQIAPFRVDFTVRETSLDFSKVKTAAFELLHKRKQLFSLGSNNALLEFLLDGTPQVKEQMHDSRKDVDRQLKLVCEHFIKEATALFVGKILEFIQHVATQSAGKQSPAGTQVGTTPKLNLTLRQSPWAAPQQISSLIQEAQRNVKSKLAGLQRSMQLYLANKDTEFILFRPIRNNIISAFVKLEQILITNGYTTEDLTIISVPSADQISFLLSSALITDMARKISTSSQDAAERARKVSTSSTSGAVVEKKISFDNSVAETLPEEETKLEN